MDGIGAFGEGRGPDVERALDLVPCKAAEEGECGGDFKKVVGIDALAGERGVKGLECGRLAVQGLCGRVDRVEFGGGGK